MNEGFRGIIPYLVSPVGSDGTVRKDRLAALTRSLVSAGVHGVTVLGSAGEFPYLDERQKVDVVEAALDGAGGTVPVIAGVSGYSTAEAVRAARRYAGMGVAGLVIMLEMYFPLKDGQVAEFFGEVAESVPDTPLIMYSNPKYMHYSFSLDLFDKIAKYKNIRYYKDASGNTGFLLSLKRKFGDRFSLFSASAHVPMFVMMLGGVGWMAGPSCLFPEKSLRLYEAFVHGNLTEAMRIQEELWDANRVFAKYDLAACLKCGLNYLGHDVGDPVRPLEPLSGDARAEVERLIDRLRGGDEQAGSVMS